MVERALDRLLSETTGAAASEQTARMLAWLAQLDRIPNRADATDAVARMAVHGRRGQRAVVLVDDLIRLPVFAIVPPGPAEMDAASAAFIAFGKGSGHLAGLNFGDVFSHVLAKVRGLPLLFKGADFSKTDVADAVKASALKASASKAHASKP